MALARIARIFPFSRRSLGLAVAAVVGASALGLPRSASATVANTAHFVQPGDFAIGLEPELTFTSGAGMAANLRYTHGLNDLTNATAIIGTGDGVRGFRAGGNMSFDFFPDAERQPGIGLGTQGVYYKLKDSGIFELTAMPYIHKTFYSSGNEVEPYFSVPVGLSFKDGAYKHISTAVMGAMFKGAEHVRYGVEVGVAIQNTETYMSGGVTYYH